MGKHVEKIRFSNRKRWGGEEEVYLWEIIEEGKEGRGLGGGGNGIL